LRKLIIQSSNQTPLTHNYSRQAFSGIEKKYKGTFVGADDAAASAATAPTTTPKKVKATPRKAKRQAQVEDADDDGVTKKIKTDEGLKEEGQGEADAKLWDLVR
jgi:hypothetical protein